MNAGKVSVGSWLNLASPLAAEVLATEGFEWLTVDMEHGPWELPDAANGFRAIESRGAVPLARVWSHKPEDIARVLDAGALGVVIPHVSNRAQAEALVQAVRYPPVGQRSAGTGRNQSFLDYAAVANEQILLILQIEDLEGVDGIGEIMAVPGIDVGFIGPHDLGLSMGLKAEQIGSDPEHERQLMRILEGCQAAGKPAGLPVRDAGRRQQVDLTGISDDRPLQRSGPVAKQPCAPSWPRWSGREDCCGSALTAYVCWSSPGSAGVPPASLFLQTASRPPPLPRKVHQTRLYGVLFPRARLCAGGTPAFPGSCAGGTPALPGGFLARVWPYATLMAVTTIKSTYLLDVESVRALEELARHWEVPKSEVLRRPSVSGTNRLH